MLLGVFKIHLCVFVFLGILLPGCKDESNSAVRPQLERTLWHRELGEPASIALHTGNWGTRIDAEGKRERTGDTLIVGIWLDGTVVWSERPIRGGPPYWTGNIGPDNVNNLFLRISGVDFFDVKLAFDIHCGPGDWFTGLSVNGGNRSRYLQSRHEIVELDDNLVETSRGVRRLDGRTREEISARWDKDYKKFRSIWTKTRNLITDVVPKTGKQVPSETIIFK